MTKKLTKRNQTCLLKPANIQKTEGLRVTTGICAGQTETETTSTTATTPLCCQLVACPV